MSKPPATARPPRLLRRLAGFAPPPIRRAASGLWLDAASLPARLRDPLRRAEPWSVLHNVGGGDHAEAGRRIAALLAEHGGLVPGERVLDIGCGTGRAAVPLAEVLGEGRYVGFDVSAAAVAACRRRLGHDPRFRFERLDLRNGDYNRGGAVEEAQARFPVDDASVDLAFATSVFSHLRLETVTRYLQEAARALAPGGRFLFTAYTLEDGRIAAGAFDFRPFGAESGVIDPRSPERAIAHTKAAFERAIAEAGLELRAFLPGAWRAPAAYDGEQDLWCVAAPKARS